MSNRAEDILQKVRDKAVSAADYTSQKAGQLMESTKLNYRLYELNGESENLERKIGRLVYRAHKGEDTDPAELDELLIELDMVQADAMEIRRKIAERKNMKICDTCEKVNEKDAQFCSGCGVGF